MNKQNTSPTQEDVAQILDLHARWLRGEGGERADLRGANLRDCDLRGADLRGANLRGADLIDCDLSDCAFRSAYLRWANLLACDLRRSDLHDCDLRGANLSGADLRGANLRDCDLSGANLSGANLRGAGVISAQLGQYAVVVTPTHAAVGCRHETHERWRKATPENVADWAGDAADWWIEWGSMLLAMIDKCGRDEDREPKGE